jgi:hypothetical protein
VTRRQGIFLSILLIVGGAAIVWAVWPEPEPPKVVDPVTMEDVGHGSGVGVRKFFRGFREGWRDASPNRIR